MKRLAEFLKATTMGGLFVLLPVIIVIGVFGHGISSVRDVVQPLIDMVAWERAVAEVFQLPCSIGLHFGVSFFLGVGVVSEIGRMVSRRLEWAVLLRIPCYSALKLIFSCFDTAEQAVALRTGISTLGKAANVWHFSWRTTVTDGSRCSFRMRRPRPWSSSCAAISSLSFLHHFRKSARLTSVGVPVRARYWQKVEACGL
jgi:uncharacterized membrane protein